MADFQSNLKDFEDENMIIVAGSVDPVDKTAELAEKLALSYPVAYGLDMEATCRKTGVFFEKNRNFLHPSCFLIRPDNTLEVASYSTGPVGRFAAKDVLNLVRFYKKQAKKK